MAFEELTDRQREILVTLCEKANTGHFDSESCHLASTAGRILQLHGKKGHDSEHIPNVSMNDLVALHEEGYVTIRQPGNMPFVSLKQKAFREYGVIIGEPNRSDREMAPIDPAKVFVVHGRNLAVRDSMFAFLRSIGLKPLEWTQAVALTQKGSPYVGEVLDAAFHHAQAVVVLFTPDDEARLCRDLVADDDAAHEKNLTPQARPNVIFEAGMAMGRNPDRTILVEIGTEMRPFSDVGGRHVIRLDNSTPRRQELAQRLKTAGCPVELTGVDRCKNADFAIAERRTETLIADPQLDTERFRNIPDPASPQLEDDEIDYLLKIAQPTNGGKVIHGVFEYSAGNAETERYRAMIEKFVDFGLMREDIDFWAMTHLGHVLVAELGESRASGEADG